MNPNHSYVFCCSRDKFIIFLRIIFWFEFSEQNYASCMYYNVYDISRCQKYAFACVYILFSCSVVKSNTSKLFVRIWTAAHCVSEIPVPSLKLLTRWSDVFPAETVAMKCEMDDSSDWTFTWYNDGLMVQADNVVSFDANEASLSINSASAAHAGTYRCMGHLNKRSVSSSHSSEHNLTVYGEFSL